MQVNKSTTQKPIETAQKKESPLLDLPIELLREAVILSGLKSLPTLVRSKPLRDVALSLNKIDLNKMKQIDFPNIPSLEVPFTFDDPASLHQFTLDMQKHTLMESLNKTNIDIFLKQFNAVKNMVPNGFANQVIDLVKQ